MSNVTARLASAAFAGLLIWLGLAGAPATAVESASAIAPPAVRLGQTDSCRFLAPRFAPRVREQTSPEVVRAIGGATVRFLVAEPCPSLQRPFDA